MKPAILNSIVLLLFSFLMYSCDKCDKVCDDCEILDEDACECIVDLECRCNNGEKDGNYNRFIINVG